MEKLLVLGGSGFVGGNIVQSSLVGWEAAVFEKQRHPDLGSVLFREVDITDRGELLAAMDELRPDAVVNAAAISNIDFAEQNRDLAWRVNVTGAENAAEGCARLDARYVFFSSDAVFDGAAGPYREQDAVSPVNFYGKTKAEAEKAVLSIYPRTAVVRISLVVGYPVTGGNSFYPSLEERLRRGEEIRYPERELRTPVDVLTLAEAVLELGKNDVRGIIHIGSTGSVSRYELARMVAKEMGYSPDSIGPEKADAGPGRAPRHRNGVISVERARALLRTKMLSVEETVRRSVRDRL
jgi:dTDP-4-dehydrorhamnose reductase